MAYWVHGRDEKTNQPGSMLSVGNTPDEAREQALRQGLIAETIQEETHPHTESIPLRIVLPIKPYKFRFKLIGAVIFLAGIIFGRLLHDTDPFGVGYYIVMACQCQVFAVALICWGIGVIFQSRTWRAFKIGFIIGLVLFVAAFFLTLILSAH